MALNKVILQGNLTKAPEVRYSQSGTAIANFGLAVNNKYKQGEELKEDVCFVDIVIFGRQAENAGQYLEKGRLVVVEGRLNQNQWETEGGQKRSKHEVIAHAIHYLPAGSKQEGKDVPF